MIEATANPPDAPAESAGKASRIWRIVLIVVAAQLAIVAVGIFLFSSMGFADAGGSCGGG